MRAWQREREGRTGAEHALDLDPNQPDVVQRVNRMRSRGVKYPRPE